MGFWAAKAYYDKFEMRYPGKLGATQEIESAVANSAVDGAVFHIPDDSHKQGGKLPRKAPRKIFGPNKNIKSHVNKMRFSR